MAHLQFLFYLAVRLLSINMDLLLQIIKATHKGALRITYSDYDSSFFNIFKCLMNLKSHKKRIEALTTEIYKFLDDLSPQLMNNIFQK